MRPSLHSVLEGSAFLTVRSCHAAVPFGFRRQVRRGFTHVRSCDGGRFQQGERMRIGARLPGPHYPNRWRSDSCSPHCPAPARPSESDRRSPPNHDRNDASVRPLDAAWPPPFATPAPHLPGAPWPSRPPDARRDPRSAATHNPPSTVSTALVSLTHLLLGCEASTVLSRRWRAKRAGGSLMPRWLAS